MERGSADRVRAFGVGVAVAGRAVCRELVDRKAAVAGDIFDDPRIGRAGNLPDRDLQSGAAVEDAEFQRVEADVGIVDDRDQAATWPAGAVSG